MHFKQKVTIEHKYKIKVALSESVMKFYIGRHLAVKSLWRHFRYYENLNNSWTVHFKQKVTVEHEYKIGVTLLESVVKILIGRHLAVKSLWRHLGYYENLDNS